MSSSPSRRRSVAAVEPVAALEERTMLAGPAFAALAATGIVQNVSVVEFNGNVFIVGSPFDDRFTVEAVDGGVRVTGRGLTYINGQTEFVVAGVDLGDVTVTTFGGDDLVEVIGVDLGGDLTVDLGDGDDTFFWSGVSVGGSTSLTGGGGTNELGVDEPNTTAEAFDVVDFADPEEDTAFEPLPLGATLRALLLDILCTIELPGSTSAG